MKTIAGVDILGLKQEFVKMSIDDGVDEFFFGYIPERWIKNYGWTICPNRRPIKSSNFTDMSDVQKLIELCKNNNRKIFFTLNEHEYINDQIEILKPIVFEMEELGVDGIIIGNLAMMLVIRDWGINMPFHVSLLGSGHNPEIIHFYKKNITGIKRCILPRYLTMDEIVEISNVAKSENIESEAFAVSRCEYDDIHCYTIHTIHSNGFQGVWCHSSMHGKLKKIKPFSYKNWKNQLDKLDNINLYSMNSSYKKNGENIRMPEEGMMSEIIDVSSRFTEKLKKIKDNLKKGKPHFEGVKLEKNTTELLKNMIQITCSLCSIIKFKEIGIDVLKIPTRGFNALWSNYYIKIVKNIIEEDGLTPEILIKLMNNEEFCSGENCFYNYPLEN